MKFCTTCGRNFADDTEVCPHDGTPLFYMGGEPGEAPKEPIASVETEPVAAEESEAAPVAAKDRKAAVVVIEIDDVDEGAKEDVAASAEVGADDSDDDEVEIDAAPSVQIQSSIAATISDLGEMTEDRPSLSLSKEIEEDSPNPDLLAPPKKETEKKGGLAIFGLVAVVLVIGVVWYFVMGPGATQEPTPAPDPTPVAPLVEADPTPLEEPEVVADGADAGSEDAGSDTGAASAELPETEVESAPEPKTVPAATKEVEPKPAEKRVEPKPAEKKVEPKPAEKKVEPKPAEKKVEPEPAEKQVEPKPAEKKVEPEPAEKQVEPKPAEKTVEEPKELTPEELLKKELQKLKQGGE